MLDFSSFPNTFGSFPNVEAVNASGPTLRDGTPITASTINDVWGAFQAILNAAGTTPSESAETSGASDLLDSVRKLCGAPGEIVLYATPSDAISANILPLKGQLISLSAYPALVDAVYIGDGNNANFAYAGFFKCTNILFLGEFVRNTDGPFMKLPDCRGRFLRALAGAATGVDAGRDYDTTTQGVDFRNMSGKGYPESPGWHTHVVKDTAEVGIGEEVQFVMRSNPGNITGSSGTVATFSTTMYRRTGGVFALTTETPKLGSTLYGASEFNNEVRPREVAFQLGIRY